MDLITMALYNYTYIQDGYHLYFLLSMTLAGL